MVERDDPAFLDKILRHFQFGFIVFKHSMRLCKWEGFLWIRASMLLASLGHVEIMHDNDGKMVVVHITHT